MCGHETQLYHLLGKIRTLFRVYYYYSVKCKPELIRYCFTVMSRLLNIFCIKSIPLRLKGRDFAGYLLTPHRTHSIKKRLIHFKNFLGERSYKKVIFLVPAFFKPTIRASSFVLCCVCLGFLPLYHIQRTRPLINVKSRKKTKMV